MRKPPGWVSAFQAMKLSLAGFLQVAAIKEASERVADTLHVESFLKIQVGEGQGNSLRHGDGKLAVSNRKKFLGTLSHVALLALKVHYAQAVS